ncbi:MAG: TorF family putative porin [Magnetococcus sp. DMHC-8]
MKKTLTVCALGWLALVPGVLVAEDAGQKAAANKVAGFTLSGNLTLVNDYVSRGISASDHGPALQGTFNANHESGFYLSLFGSSVDLNNGDGTALELDPTLGFTKEWSNGVSIDVGLLQYLYPKAPAGINYNYLEYFMGAGYKLSNTALKAKYFYSNDNMGSGNASSYLDTQLTYAIPDLTYPVTLRGHYGLAFGDFVKVPARAINRSVSHYSDYSVGVAVELPAGLGVGLDYVGVDSDGRALNTAWHGHDRLILSLSKSF